MSDRITKSASEKVVWRLMLPVSPMAGSPTAFNSTSVLYLTLLHGFMEQLILFGRSRHSEVCYSLITTVVNNKYSAHPSIADSLSFVSCKLDCCHLVSLLQQSIDFSINNTVILLLISSFLICRTIVFYTAIDYKVINVYDFKKVNISCPHNYLCGEKQ